MTSMRPRLKELNDNPYIRDTPPNGATNTGNININYDEGVFDNMLDDGE